MLLRWLNGQFALREGLAKAANFRVNRETPFDANAVFHQLGSRFALPSSSGSRAMWMAMRRASPSAVLCPEPIGHDDAIASVELDMNVSDPGGGYLPSRS
jgi:hypothetical protein